MHSMGLGDSLEEEDEGAGVFERPKTIERKRCPNLRCNQMSRLHFNDYSHECGFGAKCEETSANHFIYFTHSGLSTGQIAQKTSVFHSNPELQKRDERLKMLTGLLAAKSQRDEISEVMSVVSDELTEELDSISVKEIEEEIQEIGEQERRVVIDIAAIRIQAQTMKPIEEIVVNKRPFNEPFYTDEQAEQDYDDLPANSWLGLIVVTMCMLANWFSNRFRNFKQHINFSTLHDYALNERPKFETFFNALIRKFYPFCTPIHTQNYPPPVILINVYKYQICVDTRVARFIANLSETFQELLDGIPMYIDGFFKFCYTKTRLIRTLIPCLANDVTEFCYENAVFDRIEYACYLFQSCPKLSWIVRFTIIGIFFYVFPRLALAATTMFYTLVYLKQESLIAHTFNFTHDYDDGGDYLTARKAWFYCDDRDKRKYYGDKLKLRTDFKEADYFEAEVLVYRGFTTYTFLMTMINSIFPFIDIFLYFDSANDSEVFYLTQLGRTLQYLGVIDVVKKVENHSATARKYVHAIADVVSADIKSKEVSPDFATTVTLQYVKQATSVSAEAQRLMRENYIGANEIGRFDPELKERIQNLTCAVEEIVYRRMIFDQTVMFNVDVGFRPTSSLSILRSGNLRSSQTGAHW